MKGDRRALLAIMDHQGTRSMDAAAYFAGHGFENPNNKDGYRESDAADARKRTLDFLAMTLKK